MIISLFVRHGIKDPATLEALGRCNKFLQVLRLSEIVSVNGQELLADSYNGIPVASKHGAKYKWPTQGQPGNDDWALWKTSLTQVLGLSVTLKLARPLGRWTTSWRDWKWYLTSTGALISVDDQALLLAFDIIEGTLGHYDKSATALSLLQLRNMMPMRRCDITVLHDSLHIRQTEVPQWYWEEDIMSELSLPTISYTSFQCHSVRQILAWTMQSQFEDFTDAVIFQLVEDLQRPGVCAVSDGSAKEGNGAAAWIIALAGKHDEPGDTVELSGGFRTPGPSHSQDSYRNELAGLLAILCVTRACVKWFHLEEVYISLACDGKGALQRLFQYERPSALSDSQWDMVKTVQLTLEQMPYLTVDWHHVYGHQDDPREAESTIELDIWAKWNIMADLRAKYTRVHVDTIPIIPYMSGLVKVGLEHISSVTDSIESIRNHCLIPRAREYWAELLEEQGQDGSLLQDMDWDCLGTAIKEMSAYRRRFVSKHTTGWCGVGRNLKKWNFDTDDRCPRCQAADERAAHVWVCPAATTQVLWTEKIEELDTWMHSVNTAPELASAIKAGFNAWRAGARRPATNYSLRGLNQALVEQDRIGWKAAFEGRWHTDFVCIQQAYFRALGFSRTGRRWLISLIKKLWEIAWDLWEERNGIQEALREQKVREDALVRVAQVYAIGPVGLHPGSRRLFTSVSLEQRNTQNTQSLLSWLLRIEQAQEHARLHPPQVTQDQIKRARQERTRAVKAARVVQQERQSDFMTRWRNASA
jgi:hypothetical protein